ncbi:Cadmium, cobalt and zinc/H(+)-K(+) antiporter [subsurface metagenome]
MAYFLKKGKLSPAYEDPVYPSGDLEKNSRSLDEDRLLKGTRLKFVIIITAIVMGIEVVGGFLTNSLALLSDAGHMLTHLFALGMSFFAIVLAARPVTKEKTYGFYRAEVLVAFVNGIALLFMAAFIFYKAIFRVISPQSVAELEMLLVAILGLAANVAGIFLLSGVGRGDINVRSAFIHLIGDTASSGAVVLGGLIIYYTGNFIIDPLISILICGLILIWAVRLLTESTNILLEATPKDVDIDEMAEVIKRRIAGVKTVHDVHVWVITSHMYAMTAHVIVDDIPLSRSREILEKINKLVNERFNISHTNIQFEVR